MLCAAWAAVKVSLWRHRAVREEQQWLVCTRVNMDILRDVATGVVGTNSSGGLTNLASFVRAGLLPEWSEVYVCPAWFNIELPARMYDDSFRSNLFVPKGLAAHYSVSSYYLEHDSNVFRLRCRYHSNVLDCTIISPR